MEQNLPHDHGHVDASVLANIPDSKDFQAVAGVFKQLSDGNRIRIFWLLCHCEECVINIAALVEMSSPAVSHHLKQLRSGGLITSRREGKEVYYKAADNKQAKLLHRFIEQIVEIACPAD
ncbi:MAG TPA: helix-turn-helix transcriptional regulator [Candidatus Choladousia intestinavium]|uniref:Helix-turn-helix transcriptional regulator n=1 Tax=Candidatus Choladousia intestinavium TaxID=2840727 RepID=A0A9D1AAY6_9FIRM|nr:helix-turn-helix transcriptional regulator [Candidatus Choladousia intestinavium]